MNPRHRHSLRARAAALLSIALLPMSGLAVVMVYDTAAIYPRFGAELAAVPADGSSESLGLPREKTAPRAAAVRVTDQDRAAGLELAHGAFEESVLLLEG